MDSTRKLRRELGYELAKLQALQESVDQTQDDASAKALAVQIREQAGICLARLDSYQASVPTRMWSSGDGKLQPLREDLRRTEKAFRVHAGEWERRAETRSYTHRPFDWMWDAIDHPAEGSAPTVDTQTAPEVTSEPALYEGDVEAAYVEEPDRRFGPVDEEVEPDGGWATGPLRFILPTDGGSPEQNMLVLVPGETGLVYEHHYGGGACRHVEIEGFLVPAWAQVGARETLDRLFLVDLGGSGVRDEDRSAALRTVGGAIAQIWYSGTGDRMVPLEIDEARADELDEAWVPVLTPDGPAYLAWVNSDLGQRALDRPAGGLEVLTNS